MARSTSSLFSFIFLVGIPLISTSCQADESPEQLLKKKHAPASAPALFIFGDSILDAGNNNYINTTTLDQANFWPYGETFFKYPTGRFSDGRLVSDFIAEYAKLPLIRPFLQPGINHGSAGVNFASAGSGALIDTFRGDVISLRTQLGYYREVESRLRQKFGRDEGKKRVSRGVYLFSVGSNDYYAQLLTTGFTLPPSFSVSDYVGMVIGNLTTVIKEIYKKGGRKFAFMNVPDLGCLPVIRAVNAVRNGSCLREATMLAKLHNQALSKQLHDLQRQLKGFKFSLFDLNGSLKKRIDHPSKYGFKEGKGACCGTGQFRGVLSCGGKRPVKEFEVCRDPNEHVYWDSIHLTEMANTQLAKEMWNGASNLKKLFRNQN